MIISIASGKGGTGKTIVATNLAASLYDTGYSVRLYDVDVEAPNDWLFFEPQIDFEQNVSVQIPVVDNNKCRLCNRCGEICQFNAIGVFGKSVLVFPELCHSCGGCVLVCPDKAVSWQQHVTGIIRAGRKNGIELFSGILNIGEAKAPPVIRELKNNINPDIINIIDAPPGTSCPVVESIKNSDYVILVAEASPFGLSDLKAAVETLTKMDLSYGVIINKSDPAFPDIHDFCSSRNITVLLEIPFDIEIAKLYSRGDLLVDKIPDYKKIFVTLYRSIMNYCDKYERINSYQR